MKGEEGVWTRGNGENGEMVVGWCWLGVGGERDLRAHPALIKEPSP